MPAIETKAEEQQQVKGDEGVKIYEALKEDEARKEDEGRKEDEALKEDDDGRKEDGAVVEQKKREGDACEAMDSENGSNDMITEEVVMEGGTKEVEATEETMPLETATVERTTAETTNVEKIIPKAHFYPHKRTQVLRHGGGEVTWTEQGFPYIRMPQSTSSMA